MISEFSESRFKTYLDQQFGRADMVIERVGGGQSNPTFFVEHGGQRMVLRKQPAGEILRGAHAVDREFRVIRSLETTPAPVPRAILFCEDRSVIGTPFYLMERVEGRVFHDASLSEVDPSRRKALYFAMADAMAKLHAVRPADVGLGDFGKPGNYFERQIGRWSRQYADSPSERIPALDRVIAWLKENQPADDGRVAIAHGDFRLGNMLFHPTRDEVVAILDWELSTLGHPLADLAFCCMPWRTSPDEYGGILGKDWKALQLPDEDEFVAAYYRSAVPTPDLTRFHLAFALFRFAVIFVGIADRVRSGNAAAQDAASVAPLATKFAARAEQAINS